MCKLNKRVITNFGVFNLVKSKIVCFLSSVTSPKNVINAAQNNLEQYMCLISEMVDYIEKVVLKNIIADLFLAVGSLCHSGVACHLCSSCINIKSISVTNNMYNSYDISD